MGYLRVAAHALYGKLVIKNNGYIGANCTLMPDITIGEGAVIGANSFVRGKSIGAL